MPVGERTGLIAFITAAPTMMTSTPRSASASAIAAISGLARDALVTAAIAIAAPAAIASATRCAPSRRTTAPPPFAASRKRATSGLWRLVTAIQGRIALWYDCPAHGGDDEGSIDQEIRGRDTDAEPRAQTRAAQRDQARARARRSARERRIPRRQGAPAARRIADQHAPEARLGDRPAQRRSHPEGSGRLRLDAARGRTHRRQARLPARHARGRRRRQGPHLDDLADRPRADQQGAGRYRARHHPGRAARVRDHEADHHPRRSRVTERFDAMPPTASFGAEPYSPQRRTALVLTGIGTAGAYHAGVLRALHEAGVKIDIVAGRGVGVVGALFAAVDGSQRLWDDRGFWRAPDVQSLYAWRAMPRLIFWSLAVAVAIVLLPIAAIAAGLVVYPIDFVMKMVGAGGALGLVCSYVRFAQSAFAPEALPTWLPRLAVLVLGATAIVVTIDGWIHSPPRGRGAFWWRATRAPLSSRAT